MTVFLLCHLADILFDMLLGSAVSKYFNDFFRLSSKVIARMQQRRLRVGYLSRQDYQKCCVSSASVIQAANKPIAVHSRKTLLVASYGLLGLDKIASRFTKWKDNLAVSNTESSFSL